MSPLSAELSGPLIAHTLKHSAEVDGEHPVTVPMWSASGVNSYLASIVGVGEAQRLQVRRINDLMK